MIEDFLLSLNPIIIMVGIMLTSMAVYTALDLFTHMNVMEGSKKFIFFGSTFSLSIGIWMMNFFAIMALDMLTSGNHIILIHFISMICSFILTGCALLCILRSPRVKNLAIASLILAFAVLLTHVIGMFSVDVHLNFHFFWLAFSFLLIAAIILFALMLVFHSKDYSSSPMIYKTFSAFMMTGAIGQGLLLVMKASVKKGNGENILSNLTLNGYWLPYMVLFLSIIIFTGFVIASTYASKKMQKSKLYANDIMSALDMSSIVVITNAKGRITYVNDSYAELSQYSKEELIGQENRSLFSGLRGEPGANPIWEKVNRGEVWQGEQYNTAKDGSLYWVDTTIIPFINRKGKPYQYVSIHKNITQQKKVAKELEATLKEVKDYKYALDQSSIVAITDAKGIIMAVNDNFCKISQYSEEELIGSDHRILNSGLHPKEFFKHLWRTIGRGHVWKGEIRNRRKDGQFYWVETTIIPFLNKDGKPYQYVSIRNDITAKKKQEELLHRQEKLSALGQLAAGIAHEIRNPLTSMRGYTEFLLTEEENPGKKEYLTIVMEEIQRVNEIVEEFMLLAKPKADQFETADLLTIITHTISLLAYEAKKKKIKIILDSIDDEIQILCDQNRLKQVFLNMIKNGIEAMPDGGQLTVHIRKDSTSVKVILRDTGTGISQEDLKKIGEPFFTTKESGTGLGMMMSFKIIETHRGKIEIESEKGKGTAFYITLPLH
ncbi:PAS domain-containing protein [Bacillus testis]|uniref:PAS domain-containing protein n=1 Tax=Bacillus testis TaxID=1622072 RepID=UPI000B2D58AE|nr:PAS domain-containing protein [Bacillus testis]